VERRGTVAKTDSRFGVRNCIDYLLVVVCRFRVRVRLSPNPNPEGIGETTLTQNSREPI
jgi:hypothetical protein